VLLVPRPDPAQGTSEFLLKPLKSFGGQLAKCALDLDGTEGETCGRVVFKVVQRSFKPTAGHLNVEILETLQVVVPFGTQAPAPPVQINFILAFRAANALEEAGIVYELKIAPEFERHCLGV
jgi:hypothetical protein